MSAERRARAGILRALPLLLLACRPGAPPEWRAEPLARHAADLVEELETVAVDVGEPAARPRLAAGFGADARTDRGTFARIEGGYGLVRLRLWEPRDRRLRVEAWTAEGSEVLPVRVTLNGEVAGEFRAGSEPETHELDLPRALWVAGDNRLRFERVPPGEELPLAIAGLRFAGEAEPAGGGAGTRFTDGGDLLLPAGHAATLHLALPKGSRLAWTDARSSAPGLRLALRVRADVEGGGAGRSARAGPGRGHFDLAPSGGGLVELTLRAAGADEGEVRLLSPSLERVDPPAPAPEAASRTPPPPVAADRSRPDLVIYLVDTLRADHLGCYGYARPTSPALDAFARGAVLYRDGRAQSSWTRAAVATMLTGLEPITHLTQKTDERLSEELTTLAERLQEAGYETAMITSNGNVARRFGFAQGFARFEYLREDESTPELHVTADVVVRHAAHFLARRDRHRPFFLVVHVSDPHDPYAPRPPFHERLAPGVPLERGSAARLRELEERHVEIGASELGQIVSLYDGEIAQSDASFGRLLTLLDDQGRAADAAILFVSDHGEEFLDHGSWIHGKTLYEEQLRIPFVLRLPRGEGAGARPPGTAQQIDVFPTFVELAGLPATPGLPGRSLLGDVRGEPEVARDAFAWLRRDGFRARAVRSGGWKLIVRPGGPRGGSPYAQLFRLVDDAEERKDLAWRRDVRRAALEARLEGARERWLADRSPETAKVGREMRRRLQALGYLR